ncbi:anaphase-promoting complex subunit Hcn1 [Entophlyctis luteolus]|nr:anaphase-promoting complex subunit Hcn1 [Entophlyctis luteolus]
MDAEITLLAAEFSARFRRLEQEMSEFQPIASRLISLLVACGDAPIGNSLVIRTPSNSEIRANLRDSATYRPPAVQNFARRRTTVLDPRIIKSIAMSAVSTDSPDAVGWMDTFPNETSRSHGDEEAAETCKLPADDMSKSKDAVFEVSEKKSPRRVSLWLSSNSAINSSNGTMANTHVVPRLTLGTPKIPASSVKRFRQSQSDISRIASKRSLSANEWRSQDLNSTPEIVGFDIFEVLGQVESPHEHSVMTFDRSDALERRLTPILASNSKLSRPKSKIIDLLKNSATLPRYNEHGSLLSVDNGNKQMSFGSHESIPHDKGQSAFQEAFSLWADGLNSMSSLSVKLEFSLSCKIKILLIPITIGYQLPLPLYYTIIISTRNIIDCALELITFRRSAANVFPVAYHPVDANEQIISVVLMLLGAGLFACVVGSISSIAMGYDASGRLFKQKVDELKEYMTWRSLEPITQRKIMKYFNLKYRGKYFDESSLLNEMNDSLRMEIAVHNCKELISKVPFLRRTQNDGRDDLFAGRIASALQPCYYVAGDVLFLQGEIGNEMFFCLSGKLHVIIGGRRVKMMGEGAFFGEIALISNIPRTATVQAATSCMLYKLTRPAFNSIASTFEDVKKKVEEIYADRMDKIRIEEEARKLTLAKDFVSKLSFLCRREGDGRDDKWIESFVALMVPAFFDAEETIFSEGDNGQDMFIIHSGKVDTYVEGQKVATLTEGDHFGELAMIHTELRRVTVIAATSCVLYKISHVSFMEMLNEFEGMKRLINELFPIPDRDGDSERNQ